MGFLVEHGWLKHSGVTEKPIPELVMIYESCNPKALWWLSGISKNSGVSSPQQSYFLCDYSKGEPLQIW